INRVYVKPKTKTTPYQILKGKTPNLSHMHVFGCLCYVLNDKEKLGKLDSRSDVGMFLGYSTNSSAYRVYNQRTKFIGDNVNVLFDDGVGFYQTRVTQTIEGFTPSDPTPVEVKIKDESDEESDQKDEQVNLDLGKAS